MSEPETHIAIEGERKTLCDIGIDQPAQRGAWTDLATDTRQPTLYVTDPSCARGPLCETCQILHETYGVKRERFLREARLRLEEVFGQRGTEALVVAAQVAIMVRHPLDTLRALRARFLGR